MEATDKKGKPQAPSNPKLLLNGLMVAGAGIVGLIVIGYLGSLLNGQARQIGSPVSLGQVSSTEQPTTATDPETEAKASPESLRQQRWGAVQIASANLDAIILDLDVKLTTAMAQRWIAHATSQCARRKGCNSPYEILTAEYGDRLRKLQRLTRSKQGQATIEQLEIRGDRVANLTALIQELKAIKTAMASEGLGAPVSRVDTSQINRFSQEFLDAFGNFDATPDGLMDSNDQPQTETQP